MKQTAHYDEDPADKAAFTKQFDQFYSRFAPIYNLAQRGLRARLQQGNVESLPYEDESFDSVINTMAFSGYPDGQQALAEIRRVLKPDGRLILIDVNYPQNRNWLGMKLTAFWTASGDLIRDMASLFNAGDFAYTDREIGGFGSVHLYLAQKQRLEKTT